MTWLFAAFAIVWLAVFIYLFDLGKKQKTIAREIENLKALISRSNKG